MYLLLGIWLGEFKAKSIVREFPHSSLYLLEESLLNSLFCHFVETTFGFSLSDLLPTVQYSATYFSLPLNAGLDINNHDIQENITFEEFCTFQKFNTQTLHTIIERKRGVYLWFYIHVIKELLQIIISWHQKKIKNRSTSMSSSTKKSSLLSTESLLKP